MGPRIRVGRGTVRKIASVVSSAAFLALPNVKPTASLIMESAIEGRVSQRSGRAAKPIGPAHRCLLSFPADGPPPGFAPLLPVTLAAAEDGAVTIFDPHGGSRFCLACHVEEDDDTLRVEDLNTLCSQCHDPRTERWKHHPFGGKIPAGMKIPDDFPVTDDGTLTCLSCHTPGHEEDHGVAAFLRGAPYDRARDFCDLCHGRAPAEKDPHGAVNSPGTKACTQCHDRPPAPGKDTLETVTFIARLDYLCIRCHAEPNHPGHIDHVGFLAGSPGSHGDSVLPLDSGRITCVTCHNPHVRENINAKLRNLVEGVLPCSQCHQR